MENTKFRRASLKIICLLAAVIVLPACTTSLNDQNSLKSPVDTPYIVDVELESRSVSFENPTGEKGKGGMAASNLGVGRKGAAEKFIAPGETVTLCDIKGPGVIRHIWSTTAEVKKVSRPPEVMLGMLIKAYWDNQKYPSIEVPLGNFFGTSHGLTEAQAHQSAVHSVNPKAGMNIWLPMPFSERALFTITNETEHTITLFYNIDYTLNNRLTEPFGRLHVLYRRENPVPSGKDFEILPKRKGMGRFIGCVLGVHPLKQWWWGEGEVKVYLDGDEQFATIVGTGSEDYIGQSWGLQQVAYLYGGTLMNTEELYSVYRWHIKDPIYWKKDIRVTIQQLGYDGKNFVDRQDDWSTTTFWYEPVPSEPLPPIPNLESRIFAIKDIQPPVEKKKKKTESAKPKVIPSVTVLNRHKCYDGYRLYSSRMTEIAHLIDIDGKEIHCWSYPQGKTWHYAQMLPNGHLVAIIKENRSQDCQGQILELDWNSKFLWKADIPAHHDFDKLENGNTLVVCNEYIVNEELRPGEIMSERLVELTPDNKVVWQWHADKHVKEIAQLVPVEFPLANVDILHMNTVESLADNPTALKDPRFKKGNILFSFLQIDTIGVIDKATGKVVWAWGPGVLENQHMPTMLSNGHILVYDNGFTKSRRTRIIELDPITEQIVWQYEANPPKSFFSPSRGSNQRLPNGNTYIADSDNGRLFEVTPEGEIVWEFLNPDLRKNNQRMPLYRTICYPRELVDSLIAKYGSKVNCNKSK